MFIGKKEISSQEEKNGRIYYKLSDGAEGSATKRQLDAIATDKEADDDQLNLMIKKHDQDVSDVLTAIYGCGLNYSEAQFVIQRAMMSLTEIQEQALCKSIEGTFGNSMKTITDANNIPISELNDSIK